MVLSTSLFNKHLEPSRFTFRYTLVTAALTIGKRLAYLRRLAQFYMDHSDFVTFEINSVLAIEWRMNKAY